MQKNKITVKRLRDALKGLKPNARVRILVEGQCCDELWPITDVQAKKDSLILIVDGMTEDDVEIGCNLR